MPNLVFGQVTTISQTDIGGNWYSGVNDWGGQSFTINQAGYITEIRFYCHSPEGTTTFEIREGQSTTGTLLYTTSINITGSSYYHSVAVPNIPVCEGQYCFLLSGFQYGALNVTDPYPGGMALYSGSWTPMQDMAFEIDQIIDNEPINTTPFSNINVCQGDNILTSTFVIGDENPNAVVATVVSSNTAVIPNGNVNISGTGANRSVNFVGPATTPGSTVITVTLDDGNCSNDYTFIVNVDPAPTVNAGPDQTVCSSSPVVNLAATFGNSGGLNWSSSGTGSFTNQTSSNAMYTPSGLDISNGSVVLTLENTGVGVCGSVTDDMTLTIQPQPTADAGSDVQICEGDVVPLTGSYTDAGGCSWMTSGSGFFDDPATPNTNYNPSAADNTAGTVTLTLETSGNGVCPAGTDDMVVTINTIPNVNFSTLPDLCINEPPYNLTEGSPSGGTYSGPGVTGSTFTPDSVGTGTFTLTYTVTGGNSCTNSANQTIVVHGLPTVTASTDQTVCEGTAVSIYGSGADTYTWDNGVSDGIAFTPPVGTNIYIVTGTDANGCQNTDTTSVTVNPNPTLTVSPDQDFCLGDTLVLTASGASTYDWDSGASSNASYEFYPTQSGNSTVTGYSSVGCSSSENVNYILDDPSLVDAGIDQSICEGFTTYLSASGGTNYIWNGPGVMNENTQDISFTVDTSAYYYVTVTTAQGCVYTDSVFITSVSDPSCLIETVTSITPNNDGVNDTWRIVGIEAFPDNTVTIFNRWGDIVFQEDGYDNDIVVWDGMLNGNKLGAGTYFYVIEIVNGPKQSGWIQLMK